MSVPNTWELAVRALDPALVASISLATAALCFFLTHVLFCVLFWKFVGAEGVMRFLGLYP